jgi:membrane associated rhomboid family serine protease
VAAAIMSTTPPIEDFELHMPDDLDVEHCYRHPDRETGVHCSNCGRPICHECMTPAPVGFRCPECMAEQRRGYKMRAPGSTGRQRVITRQQTRNRWERSGVLGGGSGWTVTKTLVVLNVIVFLVEVANGAGSLSLTGTGNGVTLHNMGSLAPYDVIVHHQYWRMFTVMFLHLDLIHIAFNMWALWVLGQYVEAILGHVKFFVLYMASGLAGSVLIVYAAPLLEQTVGASGAIFGIFGALAIYAFINRNRDFASRAVLGQIVFLLVINLVLTFGYGGISWQGHIGGLIGGTALMGGYMLLGRKSPGGRFTGSDVAFTVAVVAVLVALTFWKVHTATLAAFIPRL